MVTKASSRMIGDVGVKSYHSLTEAIESLELLEGQVVQVPSRKSLEECLTQGMSKAWVQF